MGRVFDFVNVSGLFDSKDAAYRRNVRAQSMLAFRRSERLQRLQAHEQSRSTTPQPAKVAGMWRLPDQKAFTDGAPSSRQYQQRRNDGQFTEPMIRPGAQIGTAFFDPFDSMPLPLSRQDQMLVAHFTLRIGMIPIPIHTTHPNELWTHMWLRRAMNSPLLFTSICYHAAEHLDMLRGSGPAQISLTLRSLTLRSLTQTLYDADGAIAADTVAALQLLVANCMITGNANEMVLHMNALSRVINLRGGLKNVGFESALRSVSSWHFAPCTILTSALVVQETLREEEDFEAVLVDAETYRRKLETVLQQCRTLPLNIDESRSRELLGIKVSQELNEKLTALSNEFADLWKQLATSEHRCSPAMVALGCGCLAGLLLSFYYLPGFEPNSAVAKKIIAATLQMTKDARSSSRIAGTLDRHVEIWLWSLAVATILSADFNQRTQLARLTRKTRDGLEIADFDELISRLESFMWLGRLWNESLRKELEKDHKAS